MSEQERSGVKGVNITEEIETSFLDYAMSVIVSSYFIWDAGIR